MKSQIKLLAALGVVVGVVSLQACTAMQGGSVAVEPEQAVAQRAAARWRALIDGRLETAYDFLSPASRASLPYMAYSGRIKLGMWREAKVKSVSCEAELCTAKVWLKYDIREVKGLELDFDESWIKENGSWWYVQKK